MGQQSRRKKEARQQREQEQQMHLNKLRHAVNVTREKYAKDWSEGHAAKFIADGHYQWMAGFVKGRHLVLEVGAGDASSTLALIANGSVVVSLETNPYCFERARENLTKAEIQVVTVPRGKLIVNSSGQATFQYQKVTATIPSQGVLLIGGDMLTDPELKSWLRQQAKFDAVVCWNMGASAIENTATSDNSQYRLKVQNKVYDLAEDILMSGGILHIVDRGRDPTPENENIHRIELLEGHRDQASTTSLIVDTDIKFRSYTPPTDSGIKMKAINMSMFADDPNKSAFWSVVSTKP